MNDVAPPTRDPWAENPPPATESEEKVTAIAGYPRDERPAPLKELQLAWGP